MSGYVCPYCAERAPLISLMDDHKKRCPLRPEELDCE